MTNPAFVEVPAVPSIETRSVWIGCSLSVVRRAAPGTRQDDEHRWDAPKTDQFAEPPYTCWVDEDRVPVGINRQEARRPRCTFRDSASFTSCTP